MWVYLIVALALAYALYKERESMGCSGYNLMRWCSIKDGKVIDPETIPSEGDDVDILLRKAYKSNNGTPCLVGWRRNFMLSALIVVVLWFALFKRMVNEWELVVGIVVVFCMLSAADTYYNHHILKPVVHNTADSIRQAQFQIQRDTLGEF